MSDRPPDQHHVRRTYHIEPLTAFAQQVSVALTDARALDAMREAYHDPITGLPNRTLFLERLERARRVGTAQDGVLTALFIDLDRFKVVNDTSGHRGRRRAARRGRKAIDDCTRPDDTAARLGGDEFAVLLDGVGSDAGRRLAGGRRIPSAVRSRSPA